MRLRMGLSAALIVLTGGAALADGMDVPRKSRIGKRTIVQRHTIVPIIPLVPDCYEGWGPRLLACEPRIYIPGDSPPAIFVLRSPPARLPKPYPSLFSWRYGAN